MCDGMTVEPRRRHQHLVSQGYQRNFARSGQLAILDSQSGAVIDSNRPVKKNWYWDDFLSVLHADGVADDLLEHQFGKIERVVLNQIRDIAAERITATQRAALDQLVAIHLFRSLSFAASHEIVVDKWYDESIRQIPTNSRALAAFVAEYGRQPEPGEMERLVASFASKMISEGDMMPNGIRHGIDKIPTILAKWRVQLIHPSESMPGFVLADHPIVHARCGEGRYGFRSGLAVGDADLIIAPISRRLLAAYTARPLSHLTLKTKRALRTINAVLCRNALAEVACHPDDALV